MMYKKLMVFVLVLGLAGISQALVFEDDFDHAMTEGWERINYQGWYEQNVLGWPSPGGPWGIGDWDGYQSLPDLATGVSPTMFAYNYIDTFNVGMGEGEPQAWTPGYEGETFNGVLRMASTGGTWADQGNTGPFLYKMVEGDFVAEVEVVARGYWWHNLGGLMARESNPDGEGANENWLYLTYFPVWSVGNHMRDTVNGVSTEAGIKGYPCDPFLRIERSGNTFYFSTSPDGITWISLPGEFPAGHPQEGQLISGGLIRDDLGPELQVGIFHANYTGDWIGSMDFDNFSIVPEPATIALLGLGGLALIRRKRS